VKIEEEHEKDIDFKIPIEVVNSLEVVELYFNHKVLYPSVLQNFSNLVKQLKNYRHTKLIISEPHDLFFESLLNFKESLRIINLDITYSNTFRMHRSEKFIKLNTILYWKDDNGNWFKLHVSELKAFIYIKEFQSDEYGNILTSKFEKLELIGIISIEKVHAKSIEIEFSKFCIPNTRFASVEIYSWYYIPFKTYKMRIILTDYDVDDPYFLKIIARLQVYYKKSLELLIHFKGKIFDELSQEDHDFLLGCNIVGIEIDLTYPKPKTMKQLIYDLIEQKDLEYLYIDDVEWVKFNL
jgi:hypothetical protein